MRDSSCDFARLEFCAAHFETYRDPYCDFLRLKSRAELWNFGWRKVILATQVGRNMSRRPRPGIQHNKANYTSMLHFLNLRSKNIILKIFCSELHQRKLKCVQTYWCLAVLFSNVLFKKSMKGVDSRILSTGRPERRTLPNSSSKRFPK